MNGVWEGGCEKEEMMMVEVGDLGNHEEARRMKVGGHNMVYFAIIILNHFDCNHNYFFHI